MYANIQMSMPSNGTTQWTNEWMSECMNESRALGTVLIEPSVWLHTLPSASVFCTIHLKFRFELLRIDSCETTAEALNFIWFPKSISTVFVQQNYSFYRLFWHLLVINYYLHVYQLIRQWLKQPNFAFISCRVVRIFFIVTIFEKVTQP